MSELVVEVCEVDEVKNHPNADRLEIIRIRGWEVIVQKNLLKEGDPVVYFPPDSVLTEELADRLGIRKYLKPVKSDIEGEADRYRVRAARLRGLPSYGTIDHDVPAGFKVGDDVKDHYSVIKWEPKESDGVVGGLKNRGYRANVNHNFHRYKSINHLRNNPNAFRSGEEVVVSEKVHGQSIRAGYIKTEFETGPGVIGFCRSIYKWVFRPAPRYKLVAGSHHVQREIYDKKGRLTDYALPLGNPNVVEMLRELSRDESDVILFGELYGSGVQDMTYGLRDGQRAFAAFDITIDGRYLDAEEKLKLFRFFDIPTAPVLYQGPFSWDVVNALTDGPTTVCDPDEAGPFKGRKGIVITSIVEPTEFAGRKNYKCVSADYLARKNATDSH